jgi:SAM-dependent methyltransferase
MALAAAVLNAFGSRATFRRFALTHPRLRILEVNEAGQLTRFLRRLPRHRLVSFPEVDLMNLPIADAQFDVVLHSDTLEHVPDPVRALAECRRVLKPGGYLCYTVPIVVGRLTRTRAGSPPSYHGTAEWPGYRVHTEYGADAWMQPIAAGFEDCRIHALEYPAGLALVARRRS